MFDRAPILLKMEKMVRDARQFRVLAWARRVFGVPGRADTASPQERALRFIEEAIELAQAIGLQHEDVDRVSRHVFSKPPGEPFQEAGGVGVTLLALCEVLSISAQDAERAEFERVLTKTPEHFQARQAEKRAAGLEAA